MDKTLEFHQLILPKEAVEGLSARDKKRLLMLTNMMRDLNLFRKLLIYVGEWKTGQNELDDVAHITVSFSFFKILISKVFEIWEFLKKEKIDQEKKTFSNSLYGWWNKIEAFFLDEKNCKLFCFIRNKFGFHFDHQLNIEPYIETAMREVGDLIFWLGNDNSSNDIFESSNTIMLIVLCNKMRELGFAGNQEELEWQVLTLPKDISSNMNEFCKEYLIEIVLKGKNLIQKKTIAITASLLSEVNLPLIIKNDSRENG